MLLGPAALERDILGARVFFRPVSAFRRSYVVSASASAARFRFRQLPPGGRRKRASAFRFRLRFRLGFRFRFRATPRPITRPRRLVQLSLAVVGSQGVW